MAISSDLLRAAIGRIARIEGISISHEALVEDVVLLAKVWQNEDEFAAAVASSARALEHIVAGRVTASPLRERLEEWQSYHYQLRRMQGQPAALRVVFRKLEDGTIEVKGFGHRFKPADVYHRIVRREGK